ncbi:helix-turn-helix domain-containing protein [Georgenia sp. AZ-5]|uniref:helix-turn-helix domain-containing protein n=1 Tax=Georgenia sp. AZ-5 TaxID=3367526 RepID=UPI0037544D0C
MPSPAGALTPYLTAQDVADLHHVSVRTVYVWIATGVLRAERVGPRLVRIRPEDVEAMGRPIEPTAPAPVSSDRIAPRSARSQARLDRRTA